MASLQDIRRRIKSVKSIQQITNAMNMIATSRLRRAKDAAQNNRPYAEKMAKLVKDIAANTGDFDHPLLKTHKDGKTLYLVCAADKGLAGAYSSNIFKFVASLIEEKSNTTLVTVGRKARDHFQHRGFDVIESYTGISERPTYEKACTIAKELTNRFTKDDIKEIHMVYTRFISSISCVPETMRLLPFAGLDEAKEGSKAQYIYEPSAADVLGFLLPQYLITTVYAALLQSAASELSSRMNAMSNATDNAEELIRKLDLHYNKVRQAGITREITEIVGGAEALK